MVGDNRNRWTSTQVTQLVELRTARVPWDEVAEEVDHSVPSCRAMMSRHHQRVRSEAAKVERKVLREAADARLPKLKPKPAATPQHVRIDNPDYARSSITTARLIVDAELRARIEVMGITGGLLGDPPPGRSALDLKRENLPR